MWCHGAWSDQGQDGCGFCICPRQQAKASVVAASDLTLKRPPPDFAAGDVVSWSMAQTTNPSCWRTLRGCCHERLLALTPGGEGCTLSAEVWAVVQGAFPAAPCPNPVRAKKVYATSPARAASLRQSLPSLFVSRSARRCIPHSDPLFKFRNSDLFEISIS